MDTTQDSKDLQLRTVHMSPAAKGATAFSSRQSEGETWWLILLHLADVGLGDQPSGSSVIRSFTHSRQANIEPSLAHRILCSPSESGYKIRVSPNSTRHTTDERLSRPSSGHPSFSPTQRSDRLPPTKDLRTYQRTHVTPSREPLQRMESNRAFQLSSSPEPLLPDERQDAPTIAQVPFSSPRAQNPPACSSTTSVTTREKLYPEIILAIKGRTSPRTESPDPLDSLTGSVSPEGRATPSLASRIPLSISPHKVSAESGRRSSRVLAANARKEAEKAERRRLRRERKAREETGQQGSHTNPTADGEGKRTAGSPSRVESTSISDDHPCHVVLVDEGARRLADKRKADAEKTPSQTRKRERVAPRDESRPQEQDLTLPNFASAAVRQTRPERRSQEMGGGHHPIGTIAAAASRGQSPAEQESESLAPDDVVQVPLRESADTDEAASAVIEEMAAGSERCRPQESLSRVSDALLSDTRNAPGPSRLQSFSPGPGGIRWQTCEFDSYNGPNHH